MEKKQKRRTRGRKEKTLGTQQDNTRTRKPGNLPTETGEIDSRMGNRIPKGVNVGSSDASLGEQWWLIEGAVVAHWGSSGSSLGEQWLHILGSSGGSFGSSGGSLVAMPDCETAVLGRIQQSP